MQEDRRGYVKSRSDEKFEQRDRMVDAHFASPFPTVGRLFVFGIYGSVRILQQEFPEYTRSGRASSWAFFIRGSATSGVASEGAVLAETLSRFPMIPGEVKRPKTTSTSQNGMCYVMVELE